MIRDIHQQWLLSCSFRKIALHDYLLKCREYDSIPDYSFGPCIFDYGKTLNTRTVKVGELDSQIDSEEKWDSFISFIQQEGINELIILIPYPQNDNSIVKAFRECTLKAYICRLVSIGISCKFSYINERRTKEAAFSWTENQEH